MTSRDGYERLPMDDVAEEDRGHWSVLRRASVQRRLNVVLCASLCIVLTADVLVYVPLDNEWHTNSLAALAALFTPSGADSDGDQSVLSYDFYEVDEVVEFMNQSYLSWDALADDATGTYFYPLDSAGDRIQPEMEAVVKRNGSFRDLLVDPGVSLDTRKLECRLTDANPLGPFVAYAKAHNLTAESRLRAAKDNYGLLGRSRRSRKRKGTLRRFSGVAASAARRREVREHSANLPEADEGCDGISDIFGKVDSVEVSLAVRAIRLSDSMGLPSCHHWKLTQVYDFSARTGVISFHLRYSNAECSLDIDPSDVVNSGYCWLNVLTILIGVADLALFLYRACDASGEVLEERASVRRSSMVHGADRAAAPPDIPAAPFEAEPGEAAESLPTEGLYEVEDSAGRWWPASISEHNEDGTYRVCLRIATGISTEWPRVAASNIRGAGSLPLTEQGCEALDAAGKWWPVTVVARSGDGRYRVRVHDRPGRAPGQVWYDAHGANIRCARSSDRAEEATVVPPTAAVHAGSFGHSAAGATGVEKSEARSETSAAQANRIDAAIAAVIGRGSRTSPFRLSFAFLSDALAITSGSLNLRNAWYTGDISATLLTAQSTIAGFAIFFGWLSALAHLGAWPRFYLLIQTLQKGAPNAVRFFAGCFPIFMGYALLGTVLFGSYADRFATLDSSFVTLFSVMNGDIIDDTFAAIFFEGNLFLEIVSRAYLYSFISLFIYCVLNVFLAIMEDAYFLCKRRLILELHEFEPGE